MVHPVVENSHLDNVLDDSTPSTQHTT